MTIDWNTAPEPPWQKEPGREPWWSGWRQGGEWYVYTFIPFWKSLTSDERADYLQRWPPASDGWADCLEDLANAPPAPQRTFESDPPPPWQQFPTRGPHSFGWRFGKARFWLRETFLPFWCRLDLDERQRYLELWPAPSPEWNARVAAWEAEMYR